MILIQNPLCSGNINLLGLGLAPRQGQKPVQIIAHNRALRRHRAHITQLFQLSIGLGTGFLGEFGLLDALFELHQLVASIVLLAKLALDRLHLFVQIIFALGLFHLALDAAADLFLDLQDADLALHQGKDLFKPLHHAEDFQQLLLV